jgi:hypothetical protein
VLCIWNYADCHTNKHCHQQGGHNQKLQTNKLCLQQGDNSRPSHVTILFPLAWTTDPQTSVFSSYLGLRALVLILAMKLNKASIDHFMGLCCGGASLGFFHKSGFKAYILEVQKFLSYQVCCKLPKSSRGPKFKRLYK